MEKATFQIGDLVKSKQHEYIVIQTWYDYGLNMMRLYRIDDMTEFNTHNGSPCHFKLVCRPNK